MCLEFFKNLEPELNKENIQLVSIRIEDCVESPLNSEDNPDPGTIQLFPGVWVFCQQPLFVSGFNKYRFLKFFFNHPVEFLFFSTSKICNWGSLKFTYILSMTPGKCKKDSSNTVRPLGAWALLLLVFFWLCALISGGSGWLLALYLLDR